MGHSPRLSVGLICPRWWGDENEDEDEDENEQHRRAPQTAASTCTGARTRTRTAGEDATGTSWSAWRPRGSGGTRDRAPYPPVGRNAPSVASSQNVRVLVVVPVHVLAAVSGARRWCSFSFSFFPHHVGEMRPTLSLAADCPIMRPAAGSIAHGSQLRAVASDGGSWPGSRFLSPDGQVAETPGRGPWPHGRARL